MTYTGKSPLFRNGLIIAITLSVIFSVLALSCVKVLYSEQLLSTEKTTACVFLSLAATICAGALFLVFYDVERYFSIVTIDKMGVTSTCIFQEKIFISWDEIKDCRICIDKASSNEFMMLYVASSELSNAVRLGQKRKRRKTLPHRFLLLRCEKSVVDIINSFGNYELTEMLNEDLKNHKIEF